MEKVTISRISEKEQQENSLLLMEFFYAFSSGVLYKLEQLLHDDGVFFGKFGKQKTISILYKLLHDEKRLVHAHFSYQNQGFSTDLRMGEPVLEMRFIPEYPFDDENYERSNFGEAPNLSFNETVIRMAIGFKDKQIFSIRYPKKVKACLKEVMERN